MDPADLATNLALMRETFVTDDEFKQWLVAPHELLGGLAPLDLLAAGRGHELSEFVADALTGNAT